MHFKKSLIALTTTLSLMSAHAFANSSSENSQVEEEQPEVIEVVGKKYLVTYKNEMDRSLLAYYDMYNAMVPDAKYEMVCLKEKKRKSRLTQRTCEPRFKRLKRAELNRNSLDRAQNTSAGFYEVSDKILEAAIKDDMQKQEALMLEFLESNPEFKNTFLEFKRKETVYRTKHAQDLGEGSKYWDEYADGKMLAMIEAMQKQQLTAKR